MKAKIKGQVFSLDFIVSIVLYIFIVSISMLIWHNINTQIEESETNNAFYSNLVSVSDLLVNTAGVPSDWEKLDPSTDMEKISQIGLALSTNELSMEKIIAFTKLPYSQAKDAIGAKSRFIYIEFLDTKGNFLRKDGKDLVFGVPPTEDAENIHSISRLVVINEGGKQSLGYVKVVMW
ncbi:MAG: hypothetical protein QXL86_01355 [Candidatus Aenigmatarchaeota archaeon]